MTSPIPSREDMETAVRVLAYWAWIAEKNGDRRVSWQLNNAVGHIVAELVALEQHDAEVQAARMPN